MLPWCDKHIVRVQLRVSRAMDTASYAAAAAAADTDTDTDTDTDNGVDPGYGLTVRRPDGWERPFYRAVTSPNDSSWRARYYAAASNDRHW